MSAALRTEHLFKVELWHLQQPPIVVATASNPLIGAAAFDVAVDMYPSFEVTLRHGMRVIRSRAAISVQAGAKPET